MKCHCCGKAITGASQSGWHKSCIKKFFGTTNLPEIDISEESLQMIATESTNKGYTVPGVQKKMSLHLTLGVAPRLTLVNYPSGYILKPQSDVFRALPEMEHLAMEMARATSIKVVPFALLQVGDSLAYITRRVDRILPQGEKLAMEDFCQLDRRLTEDKYRGSYERCAKVIQRHSANPGLDLSELFLRLVFSFAIGNSDMHLKNFSLIETKPGSSEYVLSEAYDMLPVNVVMPQDLDHTALTLNGKNRNLHRNDFLKFAEIIGMPKAAAERLIQLVISMEKTYLKLCRESYIPDDMKESLALLIQERIAALKPNK